MSCLRAFQRHDSFTTKPSLRPHFENERTPPFRVCIPNTSAVRVPEIVALGSPRIGAPTSFGTYLESPQIAKSRGKAQAHF